MGAVGYTSGDPNKVNRSGDTMTGTLTISAPADLSVGDAIDFGGKLTGDYASAANIDVMQLLAIGQSTCVISGGHFSANATPPKVDIAATTGYIVDYDSSVALSPTNPNLTYVSYPGATGVTPLFTPFCYYLLNSAGTLVQQGTTPTATQRRQMIFLGGTVVQGGALVTAQTLPVIPSQPANQLADLMQGLGGFNTSGNVLNPNGATLTISKTAGTVFTRAFNQDANYLDPHDSVLPAQTPVTFRHITRLAGSASGPLTALDVTHYDNGGVLTLVGGGVNTSTNFRVFAFPVSDVTAQVLIQYGQNTYASLAAAVAAIGHGTYVVNPNAVGGALLGWISVIRSATNLSDPTQATFTFAPKFAVP